MTSTWVEPLDYAKVDLGDSYPLLREALKDQRPAYNTKIEWRTDHGEAFNYCQIVRTPFRRRSDLSQGLALARHLRDIENVLWDGVPSLEGYVSTCGGVRYYLGRDPFVGDRISFRPLRTTILRLDVGLSGEDDEYLTEFSLQVIPAASLCRRQ